MPGKKVSFNQLLKLRFADGEIIFVVIVDPKKKDLVREMTDTTKPRYWCSPDSPLGSALLGHEVGETVEYQVGDRFLQVIILEITN